MNKRLSDKENQITKTGQLFFRKSEEKNGSWKAAGAVRL